ncbi:MAG: hypothetical protein GY857_19300 [Desulfobacula sp.]|nr:hypothetical protein [Desulfobacula sp.]
MIYKLREYDQIILCQKNSNKPDKPDDTGYLERLVSNMIIKHLYYIQIISIISFFTLALNGCAKQPISVFWGSDLQIAAYNTYLAHNEAVNNGSEPRQNKIPPKYWSEGIRRLKPKRVYDHRVNIVVVLEEVTRVEKGIYIYMPISSYLPQNGDNGFTFIMIDNTVYKYERSYD